MDTSTPTELTASSMIDAKRQAIEISVGSLRRHLIGQTKALAGGGGDLWNARRKANKMLVEIFGQMTALAVAAAPDRRFGRRQAKGMEEE